MLFSGQRPAHDDGPSWKRHVHSPWNYDEANKGLGPVSLANGCRRNQNASDCKCKHGNHHHHTGWDAAEDGTGGNGSTKPTQGNWNKLCARKKGAGASQKLHELPGVENPDAEARPTSTDASEDEPDIPGELFHWDERKPCPGFNEGEDGQDKDSKYKNNVGVRRLPPNDGALVPREIEQNESGQPSDGSCHIKALQDAELLRPLRLRTLFHQLLLRNHHRPRRRQRRAHHGHAPEPPRPPRPLGQQAAEGRANDEPARRRRAEEPEHHLLPPAGRVRAAEDGDGVGQHERRADPLQRAAHVEHDLAARQRREAAHQRPHAEPRVAADEDALVRREDVADAARGQDEDADGQRVGGREPRLLARARAAVVEGAREDVQGGDGLGEAGLGEELRRAEEGDEEDFARERGRLLEGGARRGAAFEGGEGFDVCVS